MDYARGIMLLAAKVSGIKKQAQKNGAPRRVPQPGRQRAGNHPSPRSVNKFSWHGDPGVHATAPLQCDREDHGSALTLQGRLRLRTIP